MLVEGTFCVIFSNRINNTYKDVTACRLSFSIRNATVQQCKNNWLENIRRYHFPFTVCAHEVAGCSGDRDRQLLFGVLPPTEQ